MSRSSGDAPSHRSLDGMPATSLSRQATPDKDDENVIETGSELDGGDRNLSSRAATGESHNNSGSTSGFDDDELLTEAAASRPISEEDRRDKSNGGESYGESNSSFFQDEDPAAVFNSPARQVTVPETVTPLRFNTSAKKAVVPAVEINTASTVALQPAKKNPANLTVVTNYVSSPLAAGPIADDNNKKNQYSPISSEGPNGGSSVVDYATPSRALQPAQVRTGLGSPQTMLAPSGIMPPEVLSFNGNNPNNSFRPSSSFARPSSTATRPGSSMATLKQRAGSKTPGLRGKTPSTSRPPPTREGETFDHVIALATVKYDFVGEEDGDLALKSGTVIQVVEKCESGWWRG
jgi:hypothetical protein